MTDGDMGQEPTRRAHSIFARGVGVSLGASVLIGVVNYMTRRALARSLSAADYGFFYSAFALVSVVVMLTAGGLSRAVVVLVSRAEAGARHDDSRSALSLATCLVALLAGLATLALMLIRPFLLNVYFGHPTAGRTLVLMACTVPLSAVTMVVVAGLNARMAFVARNVLQSLYYLLFFAGACLAIRFSGLSGVAAALLVAHAVTLVIAALYLQHSYGLLSCRMASSGVGKTVLRFASWSTVTTTGALMMTSVDTLMLTGLRGLSSVAIYNVALPVVQIFMVAMVVPLVITPIAAQLWQRGQREAIGDLCRLVARVALLLLWTLVIGLVPSAQTLIGVLFGHGFAAAAPALLILGAGVPFAVLGQFMMNVLLAVERPAEVGVITVVAVVVNVVLNYVLIMAAGTAGAALATVLAYGVLLIAGLWRLRRVVEMQVFQRVDIPLMVAGGVMAAVVTLVGRLIAGTAASLTLSIGGVLVFLLIARSYVRDVMRALSNAVIGERRSTE